MSDNINIQSQSTDPPSEPLTREEQYLSAIAGVTSSEDIPEKPLTREEKYLNKIVENGGGGGGGGFTPTDAQLDAMNSGITSEDVEQIDTNKNNISNIQTSVYGFFGDNLAESSGEYYINVNSGARTSDNRYDCSEKIQVKSGEKYLIIGKTDSPSVSVCAFYNNAQAFQSSLITKDNPTSHVITISSDGYIAVCSKIELSPVGVYKYPETLLTDREMSIYKNELSFTNEIDYSILGEYYINKTSGMTIADARYTCSNMIPVSKSDKILVTGYTDSPNVAVCALYNDNKTFVSNLLTQSENLTNVVEIPQNGYIRVCGRIDFGGIGVYLNEHKKTNNVLAANGFIYNPYVELTPDKNGYYNTSGGFVEDTSNTYHTYNLHLNAGDIVILYWRASATVAAVAEFDSTYSTFQKLVQAGFTSVTRMADNVYEATKETYLVISSGTGGASVMYLSKEGYEEQNIIPVSKWHDAMYINGAGAIIATGADGYMTSSLFALRQGDTLRVKNLFVNQNTTTVGRWDCDNRIADLTADIKETTAYLTDFEYTAKDRIEYLRISTRTSDGCYAYIVQNNAYSKGGVYFDKLNRKRFLVVGDSYAAGRDIDQNLVWCGIIGREHSMDVVNYAVGGKTSDWVNGQIDSMSDDADYVAVVCGRNDYNNQISLANFRSNIESICDKLINKYLGAKLFFLTPWHVEESTEVAIGGEAKEIALQDYVDVIVDVCAKKSFPCWDASRVSGVFIDNASFRAKFMHNANDVSHLNAAGFRYVTPKIESFMESL